MKWWIWLILAYLTVDALKSCAPHDMDGQLGWGSILFISLLAAPFLTRARKARVGAQLADQTERNSAAESVREELEAASQESRLPDFSHTKFDRLILLLRPFSFDQVETINQELRSWKANLIPFYHGALPMSVYFDNALRMALRKQGQVLVISSDVHHVGATLIRANDETWRTYVQLMASRAALIIKVPATTAGSLWELNHIVETGKLNKTLFLFAPEPVLGSLSEQISLSALRALFRSAHDIELPPLLSSGDALSLSNDKNARLHVPSVMKPQGTGRVAINLGVLAKTVRNLSKH